MIAIYTVVEFVCGSLMFSYWLGLAVRKDIRNTGDGNPGGHNLWHAAGARIGLLGIFLDVIKGYLPLVILVETGLVGGYEIIPVAIAPILGHAFSPFLRFKGGKAIAVTFGVWSAVTGFEASIALAVILALFQLGVKLLNKGNKVSSEADAVMVVSGLALLALYFYYRSYPGSLMLLWLFNLLLLAFTNRFKIYNFFKALYARGPESTGADGHNTGA